MNSTIVMTGVATQMKTTALATIHARTIEEDKAKSIAVQIQAVGLFKPNANYKITIEEI